MLTAIVFGLVLPLTPAQILWVNMVIAVTLALALAFEPTEPGVMQRPPREPGTSLIDRILVMRLALVSVLIGGATMAMFEYELAVGMTTEEARTMAVNTLVIGQAFYLFNARFLTESSLQLKHLFSNRVALLAVAALAVLQLGFVYLPVMNATFDTAPLAVRHWLLPMAIGALIFLVIEGEKALTRHNSQRKHT